MVTHWKVFAAAFVIFAAGGATGGILVRTYLPRVEKRTVTSPLPTTEKRMEYVARLAEEVNLSREQRTQVEKIIEASQARMKSMWDGVQPQIKEESRFSRREISEILTPEQREKMKRWHRERYRGNSSNSPAIDTNTSWLTNRQ